MTIYIALNVTDFESQPAPHYLGKAWGGPVLPIGTKVYFEDSNSHEATVTGYEAWPNSNEDVLMIATLSDRTFGTEQENDIFVEELYSKGWIVLDE